jgi:hypothetical protein
MFSFVCVLYNGENNDELALRVLSSALLFVTTFSVDLQGTGRHTSTCHRDAVAHR